MLFLLYFIFIITLFISKASAQNETLIPSKDLIQYRSFHNDASARQFSDINSGGLMLLLVATMIGCGLFSYGLQTRLDDLPGRADRLESRMNDFETSLTTLNTALASTASCTSEISTFTIGVDALTLPADINALATFDGSIKTLATTNPGVTCQTYVATLLAGR